MKKKYVDDSEQNIEGVVGKICFMSGDLYCHGIPDDSVPDDFTSINAYPVTKKKYLVENYNCSGDTVNKALKILKDKNLIILYEDEDILISGSDKITLVERNRYDLWNGEGKMLEGNSYEILSGKGESFVIGDDTYELFQPSMSVNDFLDMKFAIFDDLFSDRCIVGFDTDRPDWLSKVLPLVGVENIKIINEEYIDDGAGYLGNVIGEISKQRAELLIKDSESCIGKFVSAAQKLGYRESPEFLVHEMGIDIIDEKNSNIKIEIIESGSYLFFEILNEKYKEKFIKVLKKHANKLGLKLYIKNETKIILRGVINNEN